MSAMRRVHLILALLGIVISIALSLRFLVRRGPLQLSRPETILSLSHWAQRPTASYLQLLNKAEKVLPDGAVVALVPSGTEDEPIRRLMAYLIATGQLPRQVVVQGLPKNVHTSAGRTRFVLLYGGPARIYTSPVLARNELGALVRVDE